MDFCRSIPIADFRFFGEDTHLDNRLEVLIYRCAYELVNNAMKHAEASRTNVQLTVDAHLVSLSVQDDGRGFDPDTVTYGAGFTNIRNRISAYNGKISVYSSPGAGTEVTIEIELLRFLRTIGILIRQIDARRILTEIHENGIQQQAIDFQSPNISVALYPIRGRRIQVQRQTAIRNAFYPQIILNGILSTGSDFQVHARIKPIPIALPDALTFPLPVDLCP